MKRSVLWLAGLVVAAGCGDSAAEPPVLVIDMEEMGAEDMAADLAPDLTSDAAPDQSGCPDHGLPPTLAVGMGALFELRASAGHTITALAGEGVATWARGESWVGRTGYEADAATLTAQVSCASGVEAVTIALSAAAPEVEVIKGWGAAGPEGREHATLWADEADPDGLYMYGGYGFEPSQFTILTDLWRLDLKAGTWAQQAATGDAPPFASSRAVYRQAARELVLVGGFDPVGGLANDAVYRLKREGAGWAWSSERLVGSPPLVLGALVLDEATQTLRWALGLSGESLAFNDRVQELAAGAATWTAREATTPAPDGRYGFSYFVDEEADELVVFGGGRAPTAFSGVNPARDVWALSLKTWTWRAVEAEGEPAPGGRNPCWVFDPVNRRLLVFGGTSDGRTADKVFAALHLDGDATRWHRIALTEETVARASCSATYSAARGEAVFGFGNDETGALESLFTVKLHAPR